MNEFIENWAEFETDNSVRLYRKGALVAAGIVDGVMPDGSAIWLNQGTFFGRALFLKSDGANAVRVTPEHSLPGEPIS
ncbi:hypothetical protein ACHMXB_17570 [Arthrobacter sp. UC242_113]|uniref:hypothetical protein n=1 Tax=Arthrobacter sp. UC242_113 TaxID=3374550 RepID=UPI0037582EFF